MISCRTVIKGMKLGIIPLVFNFLIDKPPCGLLR
jgi:hypothetical protein